MTRAAWIDGGFTSAAGLSPYDAGFLVGLAVFETVGEFGGGLPLWDRHLRRLQQGATRLEIPFDPPADLRGAAIDLLARNAGDGILRITLSAGVEARPCWCLTTRARPVGGAAVVTLQPTPTDRGAGDAADPLAAIKCTSYAFHVLHRRAACAAGADDALLLAADGRILETTTGNVFFWREDRLYTPPVGTSLLLPGVARAALIEQLRGQVDVVEADTPFAAFEQSDAIFVTNAVRGPRPAVLHGSATPPADLDARVAAAWRRVVS